MVEKKRVIVGLSGGIDSAVAALLLKKEGFEVAAVTMSIWDGSLNLGKDLKNSCYGPCEKESLESAANIAKTLGIPYKAYNLQQEFKESVLHYFKDEYLNGRTPNPCVFCNCEMKFGRLFEKAKADFGAQFFATGHYAQIVKEGDSFFIKKGVDLSKDQTYFLQRLKKEWLPHILFPLGKMTKRQVCDIAEEIGLSVAQRAESQDFIGGHYAQLFSNDKVDTGEIVDESGKVLGRHKGIVYYTVGQRRRLGISGLKPLFVFKIDAKKNQIVVAEKQNIFSNGLVASSLNLFADIKKLNNFNVLAKIRQNHKESLAQISFLDNNSFQLVFEKPQLAVTPGQAVAFYNDSGFLLGGGIIEEAFNSGERK